MSEQKYRYLKVGEIKPEGYEYSDLNDKEQLWYKGDCYSDKVETLRYRRYRVPITEEEPKMCEMVLSKDVKFIRKDYCNSIVVFYTRNKISTLQNSFLPTDFATAHIGTIWDNVSGKPVRRPVVEKCAVCGCEPTIENKSYVDWVECSCNIVSGTVQFWNGKQRELLSKLKKAGWVHV